MTKKSGEKAFEIMVFQWYSFRINGLERKLAGVGTCGTRSEGMGGIIICFKINNIYKVELLCGAKMFQCSMKKRKYTLGFFISPK